jgi:geranylgeranyl diphosphate synthase type II
MAPIEPLEAALVRALDGLLGTQTPPRLRAAMRHAVFPGGARFRPRLLLAVASACGSATPQALDAAVALELVHCASLVHDDLPCFDNAAIRRGVISVHARFGEATAVLVGDGLIVASFDVLARAVVADPRLAPTIAVLSRAVGANGGLVAGQAWESEPATDVQRYHHAKTGALFEAATTMGAIAAGADPARWRRLGVLIGEAYQLADDLADLVASPHALGKPVGQDLLHGRPSAALELGIPRALDHLAAQIERISDAVPDCRGADALRAWLAGACQRLFPAIPDDRRVTAMDGHPMTA